MCEGNKLAEEKSYLFGPVPSRRLGLSLGVDIVPFKVCCLDCVYCQLGRTTRKTIRRRPYVPVAPVIRQLKKRLNQGVKADFITISGSGEPALNSLLGRFIDAIKKITDIPVAVLTNGTLLYRKDVRVDCAGADVVLPSLDAGDQQVFEKINRPHKNLTLEKLIAGLCQFRAEFTGQIWLEVFFVQGLNTDNAQIAKIKAAIERIRPDKVQLNTAVRPTADAGIKRVAARTLQAIAARLGDNCQVVADFQASRKPGKLRKTENLPANKKMQLLLSMLKRRPCSLIDISAGLGINRLEALKYISHLQKQRLIRSRRKAGRIFYTPV